MSHFTIADMLVMHKTMKKLSDTIGTSNARKALYYEAYAMYFRATGLSMDTGKPPEEAWAEWAKTYKYGDPI